ncbi:MAG TPA: DUF4389 domain-containing protein, partial [Bacteroidales bacterium]|nr:DUF4389 domain-containing protein [Bacteroidales bacterium]
LLDIPYPQKLSRGKLLLRLFFGWLYILIPHGFMLFFRYIGFGVIMFIAWWAVLFTGKYPLGMFNYMVGTIRWSYRVNIYYSYMTDDYPPFNGKEISTEETSSN